MASRPASWPCHIGQALTEIVTKSQASKACWPCHIVQALIEILTKRQTLKASDDSDSSVSYLTQESSQKLCSGQGGPAHYVNWFLTILHWDVEKSRALKVQGGPLLVTNGFINRVING